MSVDEFKAIKKATDLAIAHIHVKGFDDIFRTPIFHPSLEHNLIRKNFDDFRDEAFRQTNRFLKSGNLAREKIGNPYYFFMPKGQFSFRRVCWIEPFDLVKYLALSILIFPDIERGRLSKHNNIVHSHRLSDDETNLFDPNFGYDSFRKTSGDLSKSRIGQWKVVTDISNFFDRIGNHSLENQLTDLSCSTKHVTLIREILLQWTGDRRSFGVPVGSDASRILSEAALVTIDRKLSETGIEFIRYVDDFRIFSSDRARAYESLRILAELLADEGLALNDKKTHIFEITSAEDVVDHLPDTLHDEHKPIDINEKIVIKTRAVVSGKSTISRYYKEPGKEAIRAMKLLNKEDLIDKFIGAEGAEQENFIRLLTKYFLYVDHDPLIIKALLELKITSIFYIVDALIKHDDRLDDALKVDLIELIFQKMGGLACPYPYQIPLLRLFADPKFADGRMANSIVDNQKILDNPLFYREAILLSFQQLDRHRIKALGMKVFHSAPNPLKRAIFYAVQNYTGMEDSEKRPLLKNMRQSCEDWFTSNL